VLKGLYERHQALKHKIHNTRIPLSKNGQRIMMFVYISVPIIGGWLFMNMYVLPSSDKKWKLETPEDRLHYKRQDHYELPENSSITRNEFERNTRLSRNAIDFIVKNGKDIDNLFPRKDL
jgi:hypothetical protein